MLSSTQLKLFAMFAMLLDHIHLFFPDSPYWFHWIGRLSATVFVFCLVQGFIHTSDRKKYFIRLYILNIVVAFEDYFFLSKSFDMIPILLIIFMILAVVDAFQNKHPKRKLYLGYLLVYQIISILVLLSIQELIDPGMKFMEFLATLMLPLLEKSIGIFSISLAICFYLFRNSKIKISISTISISAILFALTNTNILDKFCDKINQLTSFAIESHDVRELLAVPLVPITDFLYDYPQWMMGFSFIPISMYNGQKGKGLKYLFYVFYPLHLAILQILAI